MDYQMPPPAYYAHPPKGMKITTSPAMVRKLCRHEAYACAIMPGGARLGGKSVGCLVVVPYGASQDVINHEIAHCNGWRHVSDH